MEKYKHHFEHQCLTVPVEHVPEEEGMSHDQD